jgi:hypothetical protein
MLKKIDDIVLQTMMEKVPSKLRKLEEEGGFDFHTFF